MESSSPPPVVLSIDVGIRNLSYCVISEGIQLPAIHDWNNISLFKNDPIPVCTGVTKHSKPCGRNAKYTVSITGVCACATHAKKYPGYLPPAQPHKRGVYSKLKIGELRQYAMDIAKHTNTSPPPTPPTPPPRAVLVDKIKYIHENALFVPIKKPTNASKVDMVSIGRAIINEFDRIIAPYDAATTAVIIENQIGPIAMRMKTIQGMLMQYFLMRGFVDIRFVSASNKLSTVDPLDGTATPTNTTTTYSDRKKTGIDRVMRLLAGTERLEWFADHAKKDDLADSLLQGIWFLASLRKRT